MRPRVPLGFLLGLTGCSLFQVCTGNGSSLPVCMRVSFGMQLIMGYWCRKRLEG